VHALRFRSERATRTIRNVGNRTATGGIFLLAPPLPVDQNAIVEEGRRAMPNPESRDFLTTSEEFRDVSRGNPKPCDLVGEALVKAKLTPETWRLEIVSDGTARITSPRQLEDGTAIDYAKILEMGKTHGVKFLKAMQCLNIGQPLGQGLWEGVPLREVLKLVGKINNTRRVYWWGFHNNDPKQVFQSSLSYSQILDTPPGELPVFVAYRLNGKPLSLKRGGPVRMIVPWAHGFKSIKWLQRITLTNDFKANDTYADANNDPESYLKTMARIDEIPESVRQGQPIFVSGEAVVGWPGLKSVEYWIRPEAGNHGNLPPEDPAWQSAKWRPCQIDPPPKNWGGQLPMDVMPSDVWGFDPSTGQPSEWPMRFSLAHWRATVDGLKPGAYEFRVRTIDRNGYAQPEPRLNQQTGRNEIQYKSILVTEK
jgi:DMSO/TMAO reductase YedYZ molybdopterin-dependent catalytic subunit